MGVNTWDLMDKSRDLNSRPEIQNRMDAMVKAGWSVGRTWGFSLGSGLSDSPLGKVIADPTKILEIAPGNYPDLVMHTANFGTSLFVFLAILRVCDKRCVFSDVTSHIWQVCTMRRCLRPWTGSSLRPPTGT